MRRLLRLGNVWVILGILMSAVSLSAQSKDDPALGAWKLNVARSRYTPGPPAKGDTRTYEEQGGWMIVTTETIDASGSRAGVRFAAKFDGRDYPQIGRFAATVALISYKPIDRNRLEYTVKTSDGKLTSTNTRVVSADGKTLTIEQKSTDPAGRPVVNVMVFERQ